MNIAKKYLEKIRQAAFLNRKIALEELFVCVLYSCYIERVRPFIERGSFEFESIRILKRVKERGSYDYIDPVTKTEYRNDTNSLIESGDIVVVKTKTINNLPKEIFERQYLTIAEIIELNEKLNEK